MNGRQAIITPKFKKGIPSDVSNYRPIALTCTACKILESLISTTLLDYLDQHNLISKQQHGFLKNIPLQPIFFQASMTGLFLCTIIVL